MLRDALQARGFREKWNRGDLDCGDRRADVVAWGKDNVRLAFENSAPVHSLPSYRNTHQGIHRDQCACDLACIAAIRFGRSRTHRGRQDRAPIQRSALGEMGPRLRHGATLVHPMNKALCAESSRPPNSCGEYELVQPGRRGAIRWRLLSLLKAMEELRLMGLIRLRRCDLHLQYRKPFSSKYFSVPGGRTYGLAPPKSAFGTQSRAQTELALRQ